MPPRPVDAPSVEPAVRRPARWRMPLVWGLVGVVVGAGGVSGAWAVSSGGSSASSFTLRGALSLTDPVPLDPDHTTGCAGSGGYDDIVEGASVTVYDASGAVVGTGALGAGKYASEDSTAPCVFRFAVAGVPAGAKFYQVEVSHRGKVNVTSAEAKAGAFAATLGD